ncbi:Xylose isomerase-like TIM barrel [Thalassovita autumnalis]|uniref:Xylose isomerase-like TIM barrel n=1 Tax=Thalassovita autumnalis TaxID=2072972 RepID=A0A0P1GC83_9RHOB|nr:sugar phosphate isomerase/epimerase [Thalassovita autumnalis]CUH68913.1 Xylose isomerase-like TIM barrel [Thalassovita autumnalis]CUH71445.1 Xylose isomerase-like TIM barrel [Thalassovita autumnalis]
MDLSFQLYSARNATPWEGVVKTLADLGYAQVEGFGGNYEDAAGFRALLDQNGLSMPSGHFSVEMLENEPEKALDIAKTLGITRVYCPYLDAADRPGDAAGWAAFAGRLEAIGEVMRAGGVAFGWHNHDFEFVACEDGTIPMQAILDGAPNIDWEADIAWIIRGGADPFDWINPNKGRITAAHVKDIAPAGECEDEDGWSDVGHGTVDWAALMEALKAADVDLFVMEHDNPSDATRFATRSIEALRNM